MWPVVIRVLSIVVMPVHNDSKVSKSPEKSIDTRYFFIYGWIFIVEKNCVLYA